MSKSSLKYAVLSALFAALTAVFSQIAVPLPFTPVPVNLATLSVFLAGSLLGPKWGPVSQGIYVLLGLCGLPVFAQFSSGPGVLAGPTGGYLIGYLLTAWSVGFLLRPSKSRAPLLSRKRGNAPAHDRTPSPTEEQTPDHDQAAAGLPDLKSATQECQSRNTKPSLVHLIFSFIVGLLFCYIPGTLWFMAVTDSHVAAALWMCVLPFLPGDALKIAAASLLTRRLRHALSLLS